MAATAGRCVERRLAEDYGISSKTPTAALQYMFPPSASPAAGSRILGPEPPGMRPHEASAQSSPPAAPSGLLSAPSVAHAHVALSWDDPGESLTTLPEDLFDGLTALESLWLSDNSLTTLPEDLFDSLTALDGLHLDDNGLTMLDGEIFDGLAGLQQLDLSYNVIPSLRAGLFAPLDGPLRTLRLTNNMVADLPASIFDGLTGLWRLRLDCNSLTALDLNRFDPFASTLITLDIRGNGFTTPPAETDLRAKLTSIETLLTGSSTTCRGPEVTVSPMSLTVAEGSTGTYAVALRAQPTGGVTVAIGSDNPDVTVLPVSLTFTDTNWNTARTGQSRRRRMPTLTHDPSGADYDSVSNATLTVTIGLRAAGLVLQAHQFKQQPNTSGRAWR